MNNKAMKFIKSLVLLPLVLLLVGCGTTSTVPITGRKQHLLVSNEQVMSLANEQYQKYMRTAKLSTNANNTAMVKRVGQRLANAVTTYLTQHGEGEELKQYRWEFNLVQDNSANAFCMPGGKIVVYEGLLPITKNETALAIVLGHEIAHAVAHHSAERLSSQLKAQYGAAALGLILSGSGASQATQELGQQVYGLGAQYGVMLPYSRKNESEADYMGLIFAAIAGYNPQEAVAFWQRMNAGGGQSVPQFMSDHPSHESRIAALQRAMPEAMKYYTGKAATPTGKSSPKTQSGGKTVPYNNLSGLRKGGKKR